MSKSGCQKLRPNSHVIPRGSVYLVREVLFDPDVNDDDILSPIDAFTSFQFDSPLSAAHSPGKNGRPSMHSWASEPFSPSQVTTYGRNFALKCLCKKDLTDELIEVQRGEAVLHRALPDHEYIVRLYGVSIECLSVYRDPTDQCYFLPGL